MRKRFFGTLGAMCMAMLLAPITVNAAPAESVEIAGLTLDAGAPYYHNGGNGAVGTVDNIADGANATFDAETGTLTLNNLHVETEQNGIYWALDSQNNKHDVIIILEEDSTNIVTSTNETGILGYNGYVTGRGPSVTIEGSGSLTVTGKTTGIRAWNSVIIQDGATVTASGETYGIGRARYGGSIKIQEGTVTATGGTAALETEPTCESYIGWTVKAGTDEANAGDWDSSTELITYKYVNVEAVDTRPTLTGTVTITGTAKYIGTLYAELTGVSEPGTLTYIWKSGDNVLQESEYNWFNLTDSEYVGKTITVIIKASNYLGSVTSEPTAAVDKGNGYTFTNELQGVKPSVAGAADGKITGIDCTVVDVEYSTTEDFANAITTRGAEITGLKAGTYYVRYAEDDIVYPGPYKIVVVPEGDPVISSHTHNWSYAWTRNESHHWHQCVGTGDCDIIDDSQKDGYGVHVYNSDTDVACSICSFIRHIPEEDDKVESGVVENVTDKTTNECGALLDVSGSDLAGKVLTSDDRQKVTAGKDVKIWLAVAAGEDKATQEDKSLTQAKLGDYSLGMYLDIILWKQLEGENAVAVSDTNGAVTIKLAVPQSLINTDTSKTRTYEIIRIHDDGTGAKAEILPCSFDTVTNTISFETDKFSIYSIAYKDTVIAPPVVTPPGDDDDEDENEDEDDETSIATSEIKQKDNVPKTGDSSNIAVLFLLALVSGVSALFFGKRALK